MSPEGAGPVRPNFDVREIRKDFPVLSREVHGKPLVYLDSGASAQKPRQVIRAMAEVMEEHYSNVHRGVHLLSQECTDRFEAARERAAGFLNAATSDEIVWTRGATEAINLVASSWGQANISAGDEIVISTLEHHSNIVPWQFLRDRLGAVLKVIPVDDDGEIDMDAYADLLSDRTRMVSVTHVANSIGTVLPVRTMARMAREKGALFMVDGCQAAPHMPVDVRALGVDFYCFSGHKAYGPTGIGVLWGRKELLDAMPPYQGGGEMIAHVTFERTTFKEAPHRFEAGTPAIVEAVGLDAALAYVEGLGREAVQAHEADLLAYAHECLGAVPGVSIIGTAREKGAIVSFVMDCAHAHDVATIIDRAGVAVRAGHHCAHPVMERFDVGATSRASFGLYNMRREVDVLADALGEVSEIFG